MYLLQMLGGWMLMMNHDHRLSCDKSPTSPYDATIGRRVPMTNCCRYLNKSICDTCPMLLSMVCMFCSSMGIGSKLQAYYTLWD